MNTGKITEMKSIIKGSRIERKCSREAFFKNFLAHCQVIDVFLKIFFDAKRYPRNKFKSILGAIFKPLLTCF